jgi:hypothetical protein
MILLVSAKFLMHDACMQEVEIILAFDFLKEAQKEINKLLLSLASAGKKIDDPNTAVLL